MLSLQRTGLAAGVAVLAFGSLPAPARDITANTLVIQHPWTRATPGGADVAGGYVTIVNKGTAPDRLVGGSLAAASSFGLHDMSNDGGVMKMRPTGPLDIAPGGTLTLAPSGKHIMFTGLRHGLKKGDTVDGTLVFDRAGTVPVTFSVEGIGARGPDPDGAAMPGMKMD